MGAQCACAKSVRRPGFISSEPTVARAHVGNSARESCSRKSRLRVAAPPCMIGFSHISSTICKHRLQNGGPEGEATRVDHLRPFPTRHQIYWVGCFILRLPIPQSLQLEPRTTNADNEVLCDATACFCVIWCRHKCRAFSRETSVLWRKRGSLRS